MSCRYPRVTAEANADAANAHAASVEPSVEPNVAASVAGNVVDSAEANVAPNAVHSVVGNVAPNAVHSEVDAVAGARHVADEVVDVADAAVVVAVLSNPARTESS